MSTSLGYSRPLRAIGQALQRDDIESFDIEIRENMYFVRASTEKILWDCLPESLVRTIWGSLRDEAPWQNMAICSPTFERHYTPEDIVRLEQKGKAERCNPNRLPQNQSDSQLLRIIGYYADQRGDRLCSISYQKQSMLVVYETNDGQLKTHVFDLSFIRDLARTCSARREPTT